MVAKSVERQAKNQSMAIVEVRILASPNNFVKYFLVNVEKPRNSNIIKILSTHNFSEENYSDPVLIEVVTCLRGDKNALRVTP